MKEKAKKFVPISFSISRQSNFFCKSLFGSTFVPLSGQCLRDRQLLGDLLGLLLLGLLGLILLLRNDRPLILVGHLEDMSEQLCVPPGKLVFHLGN